jgi:non-ribosomal peptide synthetase component F
VGLHVERDANAVVLLVGIVAAGAVYLPFDPAWPAARAESVREDAACAKPPAGEAAYVVYTSGSTGAPKGAVVTQPGVLRLTLGGGDIAIGAGDCVLQSGPLAFDASTYEIWGALLNGERLAVATREEVLDPDTLATAWKRYGATVLWLTAAVFNRQVDRGPESFQGLRLFLTGGEALSNSHAARALRAAPDVIFLNAYGPTENTTFTTVRRVTTADVAPGPAPIGLPIAHASVAVLDRPAASRRSEYGERLSPAAWDWRRGIEPARPDGRAVHRGLGAGLPHG